jgi:hypothetical protein
MPIPRASASRPSARPGTARQCPEPRPQAGGAEGRGESRAGLTVRTGAWHPARQATALAALISLAFLRQAPAGPIPAGPEYLNQNNSLRPTDGRAFPLPSRNRPSRPTLATRLRPTKSKA